MERSSSGVRTGRWCKEEDDLLMACVLKYGEGKWHLIPERSGLKRCRKSCRLRWLSHLKPDIKRGDFSEDEIDVMTRLHRLLGNRWTLIAKMLPGRTANGVKNYWYTHMRDKGQEYGSTLEEKAEDQSHKPTVIKPQAFRLSSRSWRNNDNNPAGVGGGEVPGEEDNRTSSHGPDEEQNQKVDEELTEWWKFLLFHDTDIEKVGHHHDQISPSAISSEQYGTFDHQFWDEQLTWIDDDFPLHTTLTNFLT